jgi:hypothetical protein
METNEKAPEINESQVNNAKQWVMLKFKNKSSSGNEFTCIIIILLLPVFTSVYGPNQH